MKAGEDWSSDPRTPCSGSTGSTGDLPGVISQFHIYSWDDT